MTLGQFTIYLLCVPLFLIFASAVPGRHQRAGSPLSGREAIFCFLAALGLLYLGNLLGGLAADTVGSLLGREIPDTLTESTGDMSSLQLILTSVFAAPLIEELLFRKMFLDKTAYLGEQSAILVSGLLFGLMHGNLYQFFYAAGIGWLLAWIYVRSGSIGICILYHMLINFCGSLLPQILYGLAYGSRTLMMLLLGGQFVLILLSALTTLGLLIHVLRTPVLQPSPGDRGLAGGLARLCLQPGALLLAAALLLDFYMQL